MRGFLFKLCGLCGGLIGGIIGITVVPLAVGFLFLLGLNFAIMIAGLLLGMP